MKLSGLQIFWLMFVFHAGNIVLLTIGPTIQEAKQDAWLSYIMASILGVLIVYVVTKIALRFPKQTLILFSQSTIGRLLGILIALNYLVQWYVVVGNILRQFADFTITILLPRTPSWPLFLTMLLLIVYVTYTAGIEGIGRCAEVFGPIILLSIVILAILAVRDFRLYNVLPIIYDTTPQSIWRGALIPLSFFGESVWLLMLVSFMEDTGKAMKSAVWGMVLAAITVTLTAINVLFVLGPEVAEKLRNPAFVAISYIFVMEFIQNLSIVAIIVWILSVFIKLALYFFLACYGTAQLFKLKNWKNMIWIAAIFFFALAQFYPSITYTFGYMKTYWIYYVLPINAVGIPLMLWMIGAIRQKIKSQR